MLDFLNSTEVMFLESHVSLKTIIVLSALYYDKIVKGYCMKCMC